MSQQNRLPVWFKQAIPDRSKMTSMKNFLRRANLNTVCEDSMCPNISQCWERGVATFMILGDICTRNCRFCAIKKGAPEKIDEGEPRRVALAIKSLNLKYVVVTSVTRDDLPDQGAGHFVKTIEAIRDECLDTKIEVLIPDFCAREDFISLVVQAYPDVIGHNLETVERLSGILRPKAGYKRSLDVLRMIKRLDSSIFVKSGIMVGLGETIDEVKSSMCDLCSAGCEILTVGQYLAPSKIKNYEQVRRFVSLEEFDMYKTFGLSMGFRYVASGPLVRSSFFADQAFEGCKASSLISN